MTPANPGFPGPTPARATQTMQLPLEPLAEEPAGERRGWRRWAMPLVAFVVGVGIGVGGAGNGTDVTTTPQYQSLQAQLDTVQDQAGELSDEVAAGQERERQAAAAAQAEIEQQTAAISQRATALDQREQDLVAREGALQAAEQAASSSRTGTSAGGSSSGSVSSGAGGASVVAPEPQVSASASYGNCSEARAAGAAPVRVGDPGYGRHLDRDGDGVGCE
jgi:multidrug efflux pump subunit AcrA (membrane-fusion protein)